jgi:hypothetical protein
MKDVELRVDDNDDAEAPAESEIGDVPSLRPRDDRGGPTSFYQGDVHGIVQVSVVYENLINGRAPMQGLDVVDGTSFDDVITPAPQSAPL